MRGEGAVRKTKRKISKISWKATSSVFVGSFLHFWVYVLPSLLRYSTRAKTHWTKRVWDVFIFLVRTFAITPKTNTSAQWDFLHTPELFCHVFCPGGEHPHVRRFVDRWVICLKVCRCWWIIISRRTTLARLCKYFVKAKLHGGWERSSHHEMSWTNFRPKFKKHKSTLLKSTNTKATT